MTPLLKRQAIALLSALLLATPILTTLTARAEHGDCDLDFTVEAGPGTVEASVAGVSSFTLGIPAACQGAAFTLQGPVFGADPDVCFFAGDTSLRCFATFGAEVGVVPSGADSARIHYYAGPPGALTLRAFSLAGNAHTGDVTLYMRSGSAGVGNVDQDHGASRLDPEAPTSSTPSAGHSLWALRGGTPNTDYDLSFRWTPPQGFALSGAEATLVYHVSNSGVTGGGTWEFRVFSDGVLVQSLTHRTPATLPGVIVEHVVPLGVLDTAGHELVVVLNPVSADTGSYNLVFYDSVEYPSRLILGPSFFDTTPPSQVVNVAASARDAASVVLAWDEATDDVAVSHYRLERSVDAVDFVEVGRPAGTYHIDSGLEPETTYHYRVFAVDTSGNVGAASDIVSVKTLSLDEVPPPVKRPFTVIAVVDTVYNPYHFDFLGREHPFNTDGDPATNFDFFTDPIDYIEGFPGAKPIHITIPTDPDANVADLRQLDDAEWAQFETSSGAGEGVKLHWFPGTKIIGATKYTADFYGTNSAHGTRSAVSAAGNIHGTCPECVFVLVAGLGNNGVTWAASQPWIDIVTNSWENCFGSCAVRNGIQTGAPIEQWRRASEDGQVIVFAAGNGLANAFVAPQFGYVNSQKGTDWVVKVGAVTPTGKQSYTGSTKPVDVSSIGSSYPSTGGTTATGTGFHSGTSNAAPVVAGVFGRILHEARTLLDDTRTGGRGNGVLAQGDPVSCGSAWGDCPLGDGVLTRAELRDLVYHNVHPSSGVWVGTVMPNTEHNYLTYGHGVVLGLIDGPEAHTAQMQQMFDAMIGEAAPLPRPAGEANWFVVDSKCRQQMWGSWNGGYYQGVIPTLDPVADPFAHAFNAACDEL